MRSWLPFLPRCSRPYLTTSEPVRFIYEEGALREICMSSYLPSAALPLSIAFGSLGKGADLQGQRIERVTVYPSDFGLERMAEEARLGPRGLTRPDPPTDSAGNIPSGIAAPLRSHGVSVVSAQTRLNDDSSDDVDGNDNDEPGPPTQAEGRGAKARDDDGSGDEVDQRRLQVRLVPQLELVYVTT